MVPVIDFDSYQEAIKGLQSICLKLFVMSIFVIVVILVLLYFKSKKFKKIPDKSNYIGSGVLLTLVLGIMIGLFYSRAITVLEERAINTPDVVYKWEKKYVFPLDQVDIKVQKNSHTNVNLVVTSVEDAPIEMDMIFNMDRNNTIFRELAENESERIVLEQQVLKDNRFKELTKVDTLLSYYYPAEEIRWVFYVNKESKELFQLQNIEF